jgi:hypothetical protein
VGVVLLVGEVVRLGRGVLVGKVGMEVGVELFVGVEVAMLVPVPVPVAVALAKGVLVNGTLVAVLVLVLVLVNGGEVGVSVPPAPGVPVLFGKVGAGEGEKGTPVEVPVALTVGLRAGAPGAPGAPGIPGKP